MFLLMCFYAFVGGLILNLMPCVLPVLSIKIVHLVEQPRQAALKHALEYTAGVMATFFVLSLIMALLGDAVGWGYQMQSAPFVIFLVYLTFVLALNLSGLFELPFLVANNGGFAGFISTLLATPCTAPFMAIALGFAISQPIVLNLLIFQMLAFGLAFPYLLVAILPAANRFIPKPGPWLLTFKKIAAIPMYLTSVWLLWIAVRIAGDHIIIPVACAFAVLVLFFSIKDYLRSAILKSGAFAIVLLACVAFPFYALHYYHDDAKVLPIPFNNDSLQIALAKHFPVFVAVSADWCIPCQVNDGIIRYSDHIKKFFELNNVVYMKLDYTKRDPSVVQYLNHYGKNGVPMYVVYHLNPENYILPNTIFNETTLVDQVKSFICDSRKSFHAAVSAHAQDETIQKQVKEQDARLSLSC